MSNIRESGKITFVSGRSGSAKTDFVIRTIYFKQYSRVVVWDPDSEFMMEDGFQVASNLGELIGLVKGNKGPCRVSFVPPSLKDFDAFCKIAFMWCLEAPAAVVVDELADVTTPGKAPDGWGVLVRRIRKYGGDLYAITQRPAEADKTVLGNAMLVHMHAPNTDNDRAYLAARLGIDAGLIPSENYKFLQRYQDGTLKTGELAPPEEL